jgi:hypothetical protein
VSLVASDIILNLTSPQTISTGVLTTVAWTNERVDGNAWHAASSSDVVMPAGPILMTLNLSWGLADASDLAADGYSPPASAAPHSRYHHVEVDISGSTRILCALAHDPAEYGDVTGSMTAYINEAVSTTWRMRVYHDAGGNRAFGGSSRPLASAGISANTEWALARIGLAAGTIQTAKTAAYTAVLSDWGTLVPFNLATTAAFTLPQDSAAAFPIDSTVDFSWASGAGQPTIVAGTGANLTPSPTPGAKLRAVGSIATARKVAANTWHVYGDLAA